MPSPLPELYNRVSNAITNLFDQKDSTVTISELGLSNGGHQTCLEKIGIRLRAEHIEQNEWKKGYIEYSRPLVLEEYMIQTEFPIGTSDSTVEEQRESAEAYEKEVSDRKRKKQEKEEFLAEDNHSIEQWKARQKEIKRAHKEEMKNIKEAGELARKRMIEEEKALRKKRKEENKRQKELEKEEAKKKKEEARKNKNQENNN